MTTLHLLTPLFAPPLATQGLPPAGTDALAVGVEMLLAAVAFAALFVLFGLQTRGETGGGCAGCSGDACGSDSCPSPTADVFREEIS